MKLKEEVGDLHLMNPTNFFRVVGYMKFSFENINYSRLHVSCFHVCTFHIYKFSSLQVTSGDGRMLLAKVL